METVLSVSFSFSYIFRFIYHSNLWLQEVAISKYVQNMLDATIEGVLQNRPENVSNIYFRGGHQF